MTATPILKHRLLKRIHTWLRKAAPATSSTVPVPKPSIRPRTEADDVLVANLVRDCDLILQRFMGSQAPDSKNAIADALKLGGAIEFRVTLTGTTLPRVHLALVGAQGKVVLASMGVNQ